MTYYQDNDDDIFDYDPEKDDAQQIHDLLVENSSSDSEDSDSSDFSFLTAKTLLSLFEVQGYFFSNDKIGSNSLNKALHKTLDELTDNRFSTLHYYYSLEENIAKKKVLFFFSHLIVNTFIDSPDDSSEPQSLKLSLSEDFEIEVNTNLFRTILTTHISILSFSITSNIATYEKLGELLGLTPNEEICNFSDQLTDNETDNFVSGTYAFVKTIEPYKFYLASLRKPIFKMLEDNGFLEEIHNIFNSENKPFFNM